MISRPRKIAQGGRGVGESCAAYEIAVSGGLFRPPHTPHMHGVQSDAQNASGAAKLDPRQSRSYDTTRAPLVRKGSGGARLALAAARDAHRDDTTRWREAGWLGWLIIQEHGVGRVWACRFRAMCWYAEAWPVRCTWSSRKVGRIINRHPHPGERGWGDR